MSRPHEPATPGRLQIRDTAEFNSALRFNFVRQNSGIAGVAALWDQRNFKQTVVRGYAPWLKRIRPILNLLAPLTGEPRLPAIGKIIPHAFLSHVAVAPDDGESFTALIRNVSAAAALRGIELLTAGFDSGDPRLAVLRKQFRGREYHSRFYLVRWPGIGGAASELQKGLFAPEVALL